MTGTLLVAASPQWGYVVDGYHALQALRSLDWSDATLLHRDRAGIDRCAGRWWRQLGGHTKLVDDPADFVAVSDLVVAFIAHRDPDPLAVMERAGDVGTPVWLHYLGWYPYPVGSAQYAHTDPAQVAARVRDRQVAERARKAAVAAARRAVA